MLALVSALYASVMRVRNHAYDCGIARSARLPIPVISVGNITAGGTGKTPIVEYILSLQPSARPVVLSRGYRRDSHGTLVVSDGQGSIVDAAAGGDEPVQIAGNAPTVPVIVDAKRRRAAQLALRRFNADLLLLDDAFQHRALRRDLDIVVYDASVPPPVSACCHGAACASRWTDCVVPRCCFSRVVETVSMPWQSSGNSVPSPKRPCSPHSFFRWKHADYPVMRCRPQS